MPIDRWIKKMWCTYEKRKLIAQSLTLWIPGTVPACLLCPWNSPGKTRILEWVAISFSRGSSLPRDQIWVSCIYIFIYIYMCVCVCVCVCVYKMEHASVIKNNKAMPFTATWIEIIILCEVRQTEKNKHHMISRMRGLKRDANELIRRAETGSQTRRAGLRCPGREASEDWTGSLGWQMPTHTQNG